MPPQLERPVDDAPPEREPGPWPDQDLAAVRRYLRFLGAARHEIDDLAQEVLLAAVRSFGGAVPPLPWLLVTARHALQAHLRRLGRRREVADLDRLAAAWTVQMGDDGGAERRAALAHCLRGLPERSRLVVELRYRDGWSRDAIAARTGLGIEGVKSLLDRVRRALGECIDRRIRHD
jgi:RNA polymerase sigma-70 factor (ECF subfamily)